MIKTLHGLQINLKKHISTKKTVFKHYSQDSNNLQILNKLESLYNLLFQPVPDSKCNYYSRMTYKLNTTQQNQNLGKLLVLDKKT